MITIPTTAALAMMATAVADSVADTLMAGKRKSSDTESGSGLEE
jgi:hypothetical protein